MRVNQDVLEVLDRGRAAGSVFYLPAGKLDRKLYEQVNKALTCAGGKWDRRAQGHVFDEDAEAAVDAILATGQVTDARQEFGAFYTPGWLAERVVREAEIGPGMVVLEPSAGDGALVAPALAAGALVEAIEIRPGSADQLRARFGAACAVFTGDFLTYRPATKFEKIVMNPPFQKQADARHVLHAAAMLEKGGRLVAIMSAAVLYRQTQLYAAVRDLAQDTAGSITPLPADAFKSAGTSVNTALVVIEGEETFQRIGDIAARVVDGLGKVA